MPRKTTHLLPNIPKGNAVRIRIHEQNLWDKKDIVIKQINRPRLQDDLSENGNLIIRNYRHLIPTNEKFTNKFTYDNIIQTATKLPESVAQPQTANLPKPVTSSTNINPSKPIAPNGTKVTQLGCFSKKSNRYIGQC